MRRSADDSAWLVFGGALLGIGAVAYAAGSFMRLGNKGAHPLYGAYGFAAGVIVLLGMGLFIERLQVYQARREVERTLGCLGERYRVYGRVVLRARAARPAVADYLVVGRQRVWPLVIDRTPEAASTERFAGAARRAARTGELMAWAMADGSLPVAAEGRVEPVLVALRRRVEPAMLEGVHLGNPEHLAAVLTDETR